MKNLKVTHLQIRVFRRSTPFYNRMVDGFHCFHQFFENEIGCRVLDLETV